LITGELWRATAPARVEVGKVVRVLSVDGLILRVEVVDGSSAQSQSAGKE
jgi:membrane-bound ClpP family serine protease